MAKERKCLCCGKTYEYCPNCGKASSPWKIDFDTEECRDIFNIISAYNMGIAKEKNVLAIIEKYSVTDFMKYKDSINAKLQEMFSKNNRNVKNVEIPVVEEVEVKEDAPETVEEEVKVEETSDKPEYVEPHSRRRRNRLFE